jgi:arabinogalactan oligomer/maltooligosaccharide transport system permease protein
VSPSAAPDRASRPEAFLRRLAVGLGLALVLGLGLELAALWQAQGAAVRSRERREALVAARAVADVVAAAGDDAAAVARFAGRLEAVERIRVVDLESISLTASTRPADAAPRRLGRDEKSLYDRAQRLRANAEQGSGRQPVALLDRQADGTLEVGVPLRAAGGEGVRGMVLVDRGRLVEAEPPAWWVPLLLFVEGMGLVLAAGLLFGRRRAYLVAVAVVVLLANLAGYAAFVDARLAALRTAETEAVAARLAATAEAAAGLAPPEALAPATWDADLLGRPRTDVGAGGEIDRAMLARRQRAARAQLAKLAAGVAAVSLGLLLVFALGLSTWLRRTVSRHHVAYLYVVPAMLGMLVLVFFPFLYGITLSFTESNLYNTGEPLFDVWIGLDNYAEILADWKVRESTPAGTVWDYQNFYWTLGFTVVWTVSNVTFGVTVGLLLALLLNAKGLALKPIYRVLLILPWAVPNYITALVWRGMFHRQFGVINQMLALVGIEPVAWFEAPLTSFLAVLATNGWLSFPFMMVVSLGALQSIPADLYEAARVDGASRWQQLRTITLPSLKPALVPAVILSVIWTFNMFNIIYLTSKGEPAHSTEILITEAYKIAFEQYRYGYAAAYSTVIFLILLVYGVWQNRFSRATEGLA